MLTGKKESKEVKNSKTSRMYWAGVALVAAAVLLLLLTGYPIAKEEIRYALLPKAGKVSVLAREVAPPGSVPEDEIIYPQDEEFGIVIPKIAANSRIIANVNWQNSQEYQRALTKGVAHARGSALPGTSGNIFLFAHSGVDFYEATRYNAVFYLVNKLEKGDEIDIFYQKQKFAYKVLEKTTVNPEEISYLEGDAGDKTLTLMTCWPPGTTLKRMIVIAEQEK